MKKILVFSAAFGSGHIKAAEALIEEFQRQDTEIKIIHTDFGSFFNRALYKLLQDTYLGLMKYAPKVWGDFYYDTATILPDSAFQSFLNKLGRNKVLRYLNKLQPDLIVCTYPTASGVIAQLKQENLVDIPLATVVTDYAAHSQWTHADVDLYFVGCEDVYEDLVGRGINQSRIQITGIPVSSKFEFKLNRQEILARLGMDSNLPTVLVMCGTFGILNDIKALCQFFADIDFPVQSIVVCGKDKGLYKSIKNIAQKAKNPMVCFGYVNNVEQLMTAADIIITKAGGLTVSEALSKKLPMVIYKPIPGQEEKNAVFLVKNGCAKIADTLKEIQETIAAILKHPQEITKMQHAAARTLPGRAAERAVTSMLQLLKKNDIQEKIG